MEAPKIDRNVIKWSGYYNSPEQADEFLKEKTKKITETEKKLVVSAKKELQDRKCHGLFLYKFTVILCNEDKK